MTDTLPAAPRSGRIWFVLGLVLLSYAVAGNYLVLPGYRRFLEHGSPGAGGRGVDVALILGATRTILWMLAFHIGAFCLAIAALAAKGDAVRRFRRWFTLGAVAWLALWTAPSLPGPYAPFFAVLGVLILVLIVAVFAKATRETAQGFQAMGDGRWQVASYFFFALATWDMCGLGSVGGILQPDAAVRAASQPLVVAQTTKLILELTLAWGLLAIGAFARPGSAEPRTD